MEPVMLVLHGHPLSTFVMKVKMALYELGTPFRFELLQLQDDTARERFYALWPLGKMPVLRDDARDATVPETSIIIDYLDSFYPGRARLVPEDPDLAWRARLYDRLFDLHVQTPMQKVIDDRLRPSDAKDPHGVTQALAQMGRSLDYFERELAGREWALGGVFSMADCAAAPALFYADKLKPLAESHPVCLGYFERLKARPSFARVLAEAEPYFHMYPG
jgi:glutathione S-transferase